MKLRLSSDEREPPANPKKWEGLWLLTWILVLFGGSAGSVLWVAIEEGWKGFQRFAGVAAITSVMAALFNAFSSRRIDRAYLSVLDSARRTERAAIAVARPDLLDFQETAIALHAQELAIELRRLRTRALWAFIPGLLLCSASLLGPFVAYKLAVMQPNNWEYMIGGSTLAAVLLGAGTALLRHDNKMREQIQASQGELLYFSRVKAGLDCALTLGGDEYDRGLRQVTAHLLGAPPALAAAGEAGEGEKEEKAAEPKTGETDREPVIPAGIVVDTLGDLMKKAIGAKGKDPE